MFLPAIINDDILRYERVKKKAYIRLKTSCGILNLELHSDIVRNDEKQPNVILEIYQ